MDQASGPLPLPAGASVQGASARGLRLASPTPVPRGAVLEFDLLLGARPLAAMGRVVECSAGDGGHVVQIEFLAMAQVDRDSLADFLTAVGPSALRVRTHSAE